jgi:hypothetical protein
MTICNAWWRVLRRALAVIAGCGALASLACCGKPPTHPTLKLVSSSINPNDVISIGQVLHVTAHTNVPTANATPYLFNLDGKGVDLYKLHDDGTHGDQTAHDGEWALDLVWLKNTARGTEAHLGVELVFPGPYSAQYGAQAVLKIMQQPMPKENKAL